MSWTRIAGWHRMQNKKYVTGLYLIVTTLSLVHPP